MLRLSRALELPLRERNGLLGAAGFAQRWHDGGEAIPEPLVPVVDRILSGGNVPSYAINGRYEVLRANQLGWGVLRTLAPEADEGTDIARLFLGKGPHRDMILDYPETARAFLARLRNDAAGQGPSSPLHDVIAEAEADPVIGSSEPVSGSMPVLPIRINFFKQETSWITVLLSFGTPQDAMVEQLVIEQFIPADDATEALLKTLMAAG